MIHLIQGDCENVIPDLPHHEMVFLDPMAGTGTVGRVCNRLGRNCTLIEIDPEYCRKIQDDLEELDSLNKFYDEIGLAESASE